MSSVPPSASSSALSSMSAHIPMATVRLLVVDPLGCVDALLQTRPPHPASHGHLGESLESVLRHPAWHVPSDTPIARLDVLPFHEGRDFLLRGPMPEASLPIGAVRPPYGPRRVYRGERWDTLGMLASVSIDVYLTLVCQVGGLVTLAGSLID